MSFFEGLFKVAEKVEYVHSSAVSAWWQWRLRGAQNILRVVPFHGNQEVEGQKFYSDAQLTALVTYEDRFVAVIGFLETSNSLRILQLQGIKQARLFGVDTDQFLVTTAEHMAASLNKRSIQILPACRHTWFSRPSGWIGENDCPELITHRERMCRRYDITPRGRGYRYVHAEHSGVDPWWEKQIEND